MNNTNTELLDLLKTRLPDFEDQSKLNNLIIKAEKLHEINGKTLRKSYPSLMKAMIDLPLMLKDKYKIIPERCRSLQGSITVFYELPPALAKKALDTSLQAAKKEYLDCIEQLKSAWLETQLNDVLEAKKLEEERIKAEEEKAFKSKLLEALQRG